MVTLYLLFVEDINEELKWIRNYIRINPNIPMQTLGWLSPLQMRNKLKHNINN